MPAACTQGLERNERAAQPHSRRSTIVYGFPLLVRRSDQTALIERIDLTDQRTRTILLYPLTPFFIVFCNVLATSNEQDYHTLTQIMTALSRIKDSNAFISGLYGLLSQFMDLCGQLEAFAENHYSETNPINHLPQGPERLRKSQSQYGEPTSYDPQSRNFWDRPILDDSTNTGLSMADNECHHGGLGQLQPSMWDDSLMWELFNTQPSLEWFDMAQVSL